MKRTCVIMTFALAMGPAWCLSAQIALSDTSGNPSQVDVAPGSGSVTVDVTYSGLGVGEKLRGVDFRVKSISDSTKFTVTGRTLTSPMNEFIIENIYGVPVDNFSPGDGLLEGNNAKLDALLGNNSELPPGNAGALSPTDITAASGTLMTLTISYTGLVSGNQYLLNIVGNDPGGTTAPTWSDDSFNDHNFTVGSDYIINVVPACTAPTITAAQSIKTHTGVGDFGINMAVPTLSQTDDVECRLINSGNPMRVVVTFSTAVVAVDGTFNAGAGQEVQLSSVPAGTITVSGITQPAANKLEIALSAVPNASCLRVLLHNIACDAGGGSPGSVMPDVTLSQRVLLCDAVGTGNGLVESNDVSLTKSRASLGTVDGTTFRADYDTDGTISNTDVSRAKAAASLSQVGVSCP